MVHSQKVVRKVVYQNRKIQKKHLERMKKKKSVQIMNQVMVLEINYHRRLVHRQRLFLEEKVAAIHCLEKARVADVLTVKALKSREYLI